MSLSSLLAQAFSNGKVNQYWAGGGGSRIYKSELLSHLSNSFVCFAYTNGNYWGGGGGVLEPPQPPPISFRQLSAFVRLRAPRD